MQAKKDEQGFMSAETQNNRFINVLQLAYLSAVEISEDKYVIPSHVVNKIETELDFNTTLTKKKDIIEEQKKKYRKRQSYLFFSNILCASNYESYNVAREILLSINSKMDKVATSMTHMRYSMESLHLALDDYFGTNKVIVTPSRFLYKKNKSKSKSKVSKNKKVSKTRKKVVDLDQEEVPF
jgi:hypothetical protein